MTTISFSAGLEVSCAESPAENDIAERAIIGGNLNIAIPKI
jgi:hypothetical protein